MGAAALGVDQKGPLCGMTSREITQTMTFTTERDKLPSVISGSKTSTLFRVSTILAPMGLIFLLHLTSLRSLELRLWLHQHVDADPHLLGLCAVPQSRNLQPSVSRADV